MNTLLKRKVLEMLISRTLREMKTDPERSVRNIVELAHSCSKGKFQKSLFARVSDMLTDKHSAYYTMAKNIVKGVDPQAVTDFGVAIGYDAFTFGTRLIRENEKKLGITIPWIIWIDGGMPKSEYEKLITEGIALGIYTYVFTGETTVDEAAICADKYRHCPFVYLADGANAPDEAQIRRLGNTKNLITLFDSDASEYRSAVQCAGENGLLYGTYKKYADESVGAIVSGSWIDSIAEQAGVCAVLLPDGASDEAVRAVSSWVEKARLGQSYPLIVSEAGNDSMLIGSVISGEGCNVAFCPDSRVITERGVFSGSDFSIVKRTLCEILTLIKQRKVKA